MQVSAENIVIVIVVITLIFLIVGIAIVVYVRLYNLRRKRDSEEKEKMRADFERLLFQSQVEVQEMTKSALSKELHDNVGQLLSTTKMLLGLTKRSMTSVPDTFVTAHETLGRAILELRTISKALDREWLEQFSFVENLTAEINRINSSDAIQISFDLPQKLPFDPGEQIILYRVVQESIQNAIKHAEPKKITISVTKTNELLVVIQDDGKGMTAYQEGMGMKNMRQRMKLIGGTIEWQTSEPTGTAVILRLPLKKQT